jgi:hypothetical protein
MTVANLIVNNIFPTTLLAANEHIIANASINVANENIFRHSLELIIFIAENVDLRSLAQVQL